MACYIFRIDTTNKFIINELKSGKLRQGWGMKNMYFKNDLGDITSESDWIDKYHWEDTANKKKNKFKNLRNMLNIKKGDIVVIPKFPKPNCLEIARIAEEYKFCMTDTNDDFGHLLKIDLESVRIFNYSANSETKVIHSKLRAYQSPINLIYNKLVIESIENLINMESVNDSIKIEDIIKKNFEDQLENIREGFYKVTNRDIEDMTAKIFTNRGYILQSRNRYNKEGGDVDIILTKNLDILEEIDDEKSSDLVYIQVKHKTGENFNDIEGINQLERIVKSDFNDQAMLGNIYKVLVCTAKSYHREMEESANEKGIILVNGLQLARLVIKHL